MRIDGPQLLLMHSVLDDWMDRQCVQRVRAQPTSTVGSDT